MGWISTKTFGQQCESLQAQGGASRPVLGKPEALFQLPRPLQTSVSSLGSNINSCSWSTAWELGGMLGDDRKYIFVSAPGSWHRAPKTLVIS